MNDIKHGQGVWTCSDGDSYYGQFINGQNKDKEFIFGQMNKNMKGSELMIYNTEKESGLGQIDILMKVIL